MSSGCVNGPTIHVPGMRSIGLSPGSSREPKPVFRHYHERIVAVAVIAPHQRAATSYVDHPIVLERRRAAVALVLVKLKRATAAETLSGFRTVVAGLRSIDRIVANHHPHPGVAIDERRAAEIIESAILYEDRLFRSPLWIVSP